MTDDIVSRLKKKRGVVRACITKHIKVIESELQKTETDLDSLEETLQHLIENSNEMKTLDSELENILDPRELENDLKTTAEYQEKIITWKFRAMKKLKQKSSANENKISPNTSATEQTLENQFRDKINIKLPKLCINKFYGEISHWLSFWNSFESAVHNNESLDKISKFNYLKAYLGGTALNTIEGFAITPENYDSAIKLLENRFGQKEMLINTHMNNILNISPLKNSNDVRAFRRVFDNIQTETRSLASLGVSSEAYSYMLCPMLLKMLPSDLVLEFNKNTQNSSYAIKDLINFLSNQLVARERTYFTANADHQRDSYSTVPRKSQFSGANQNKFARKLHFSGAVENVNKKITAADLLSSELHENKYYVCVFCDNENHKSSDCKYARTLSLEDRKAILIKKGSCFKCLKLGHISKFCKVKVSCNFCGKRHSSLMCYLNDIDDKKNEHKSEINSKNKTIIENSVLTNNSSPNEVYLQTLIVNVNNSNHFLRAIIDTGSSRSYISKYAVHVLKLKEIGEETVMHGLFSGIVKNEKHKRYVIELSNIEKSYSLNVEVMDQKKICSSIAKLKDTELLNQLKKSGIFLSDICLNENYCYFEEEPNEVNLLLGADYAGKLFTGEIKHLSDGLLAMNTKLGWTIIGKYGMKEANQSNALLSLLNNNMAISDYWSLDIIGIKDPIDKKSKLDLEIAAKDHFLSTVSREPDGRYIVNLPWIEDHPPLSDCRNIAERRLANCVKHLKRSGKINEYEEVFENWAKEDIIEELPSTKHTKKEHFLPHRPVFKENSTTKVRPVFDASAREKNFPSLNDCLEKGPNLLELIPSIINRFRLRKIGVIADIEKAFLQIKLQENDRPYLKFLWWENGQKEKLKIFQHNRVVFGVSSSPFLLGVTLEYHLNNTPTHLQETAQKLKSSFYVDNCVLSLDSEDELGKFINESQALLRTAKFNLRGWEHTPIYLTSKKSNANGKVVPVLGLNWKLENDSLSVDLKNFYEGQEQPITKRKILSAVHRIFDPIGFTCPITLKPKLLLQECWKQGFTWDSELPQVLAKKFENWRSELENLKILEIPRYLMKDSTTALNLSFHIFCDASKSSYAACVFLRIEDEYSVSCQLVQARSRIAPLKSTSVPRLELLACTIAARLAHTTKSEMNLQNIPSTYWSDSINALYWIKGSENWATFVYNRVQEIKTLSDPNEWKHIAGHLNPADLPSRGCSPAELLRNKWWEGPHWLKQPPNDWPISKALPDFNVVNSEKRKLIVSATNVECDILQYTKRISSYRKIVRILAWIYRFISNSMKKKEDRKTNELAIEEIEKAEKGILKSVQKQCFNEAKNLKLQIFSDPEGIVRVSTRIAMRKDLECFRYPILLPSKHQIVKKLIFEKHLELSHSGLQTLMSNLRENFWILKSRKTIRQVIRECIKCKRFNSRPMDTLTAPLPEDRIRDAAAFEVVGVDLCGPMYLKNKEKCWAVIFTCAIYRAVHFELVTSLSTDSFLLSLRRFIARRGRPMTIYSDNGTNLVGAFNELKQVDWKKIEEYAKLKKIHWKFNPPSAPWWGGFWERLIGMLKRILRRNLGNACLTYEELYTVTCDAESSINSRPLTYMSESDDDLVALTPAMFIQDLKETGVPDIDQIDATKLRKRHVYKQKLCKDLRKRFRNEYLGQLKPLSNKCNESTIKEGDIVLIGDNISKRIDWPLAKIMKIFPGRDGKIRVVELKTKSGRFLRPIQRLYPLEVRERSFLLDEGSTIPTIPKVLMPDERKEPSTDPDIQPAESPEKNSHDAVKRTRYGRVIHQRKL